MKDKRIIDFFEEYKEKNNCPEYMLSGLELRKSISIHECDELIVNEKNNNYEFLYIKDDIIEVKVTYDKDYKLNNLDGQSVEINYVESIYSGKKVLYTRNKQLLFFKDNEFKYSGYVEDPYVVEIWNGSFSKKVNKISNLTKLKTCKQICEDMGRTEFVDILNTKIVVNSLTSKK